PSTMPAMHDQSHMLGNSTPNSAGAATTAMRPSTQAMRPTTNGLRSSVSTGSGLGRRSDGFSQRRMGLECADDVFDALDELTDVVGLDRREGRDTQLVASQLAVGLRVDDAVGPKRLRDHGGVDVVIEVDRGDDLRAVLRVGDERGRVVDAGRPVVER